MVVALWILVPLLIVSIMVNLFFACHTADLTNDLATWKGYHNNVSAAAEARQNKYDTFVEKVRDFNRQQYQQIETVRSILNAEIDLQLKNLAQRIQEADKGKNTQEE